MEEIVRPAQAPLPSPGFKQPPTNGLNQDPALLAINAGAAQRDQSVYARTDEPEDFNRNPLTRVLVTGAQEICSKWITVAGSYEINPNACSVWRLRSETSTLTLTFAALDALPDSADDTLWATAIRVATVEVIIEWATAATRTVTLSSVRFPGGTKPSWTATASARDAFIVQITSDGEKYGFATGMDTKVPA